MDNESRPQNKAQEDRSEPPEKRDATAEYPLSKLLTGPTPDKKPGKVPSKR
jgi:hypothetical protein